MGVQLASSISFAYGRDPLSVHLLPAVGVGASHAGLACGRTLGAPDVGKLGLEYCCIPTAAPYCRIALHEKPFCCQAAWILSLVAGAHFTEPKPFRFKSNSKALSIATGISLRKSKLIKHVKVCPVHANRQFFCTY